MSRILICPLNWGLGHATRCRPVIDLLIDRGHEVHLAGDGPSLLLLKKTYPGLPSHPLSSLHIVYGINFWTTLIRQVPLLIKWMYGDRRLIRQLQQEFQFDVIFSDSRPGARCRKVVNIFMINQPSPIIPFKGMEWLVHHGLYRLYRAFFCLWIPDLPGKSALSGRLARLPQSIPNRRIGFLSTLEQYKLKDSKIKPGRILAIVSGPEPSRSDFEQDLLSQLADEDALVVGGKPGQAEQRVGYTAFLDARELALEINQAEYVICRAGYSTLMDLACFNKRLILVPTPGQTEQEYLARTLQERGQGTEWKIKQDSWKSIRSQADLTNPFYLSNDHNLLIQAVEELEQVISKNIDTTSK